MAKKNKNKKEVVYTYSFVTGLSKTLTRVVIIAGPIMFAVLPEPWMNLTLGGLITFGINYAKNYKNTEVQNTPSKS